MKVVKAYRLEDDEVKALETDAETREKRTGIRVTPSDILRMIIRKYFELGRTKK